MAFVPKKNFNDFWPLCQNNFDLYSGQQHFNFPTPEKFRWKCIFLHKEDLFKFKSSGKTLLPNKVKSPHKSFWLVLFQFSEAFGTMLCKILSQGGDQILEILIGKDPINPIRSIHAHNYQGTIPTNYHLKKSNHRSKIKVVLR